MNISLPTILLEIDVFLLPKYLLTIEIYMNLPGILLWEIYSFGEMPYAKMKNPEVAKFVAEEGRRLDKPRDAPEAIYHVMMQCWAEVTAHSVFLHVA